jgi:hypothetical protein
MLFWESYGPGPTPGTPAMWRIWFQARTGGAWSAPAIFDDPTVERTRPAAVADDQGGVWLFWLQRSGGMVQVRYNRHDGTRWQLPTAAVLPPDGGQPVRVEDDLVVMHHPTAASQRLWLFWSRRDPAAPGQTRWGTFYRIKQGLDPTVSDWSPVRAVPKASANDHDREPAPILAGGDVELFWTSSRAGALAVFHATLAAATLSWGAAQQVTAGPFTNRTPAAAGTGAGTLLVYRSNASLTHVSQQYAATRTLDVRYAGTTTVDTRAAAKIALRGSIDDFLTYTYDLGHGGVRTNADRIARDTVGLYLRPTTTDPAQVAAAASRLAGALGDFLPVTERAVFIVPT